MRSEIIRSLVSLARYPMIFMSSAVKVVNAEASQNLQPALAEALDFIQH
jgi:hypothetical protein